MNSRVLFLAFDSRVLSGRRDFVSNNFIAFHHHHHHHLHRRRCSHLQKRQRRLLAAQAQRVLRATTRLARRHRAARVQESRCGAPRCTRRRPLRRAAPPRDSRVQAPLARSNAHYSECEYVRTRGRGRQQCKVTAQTEDERRTNGSERGANHATNCWW